MARPRPLDGVTSEVIGSLRVRSGGRIGSAEGGRSMRSGRPLGSGGGVQNAAMESFRGLRTRVRRDAAVAAALVVVLAVASVSWELPELISGHAWQGTARSLAGHLLLVVAGAHVVMLVFGFRRGRDLKRAVRHNELLALHDPLTGLPNRVLFFDRLEQALARSRRDRQLVAVLMFDLDHFKGINDRYGHLAGDAVLREVAERLRTTVRDTDTEKPSSDSTLAQLSRSVCSSSTTSTEIVFFTSAGTATGSSPLAPPLRPRE